MIKPKQIYIEPTNRCNLRCKGCPSVANDSFPVGDMSLSFFKSIIDRIDWDCVVLPFLNGEPFLHPQFFEMIRYLNEKGQKFYVTTNLTVWKDDVLRELIYEGSRCYQLLVSVDGLLGDGVASKARPGTDEVSLSTNLQRLIRIKNELDSRTEIALKLCERGQDWGEIEEFVHYWLDNRDIDHVIIGKILRGENEESMRTHKCQNFDNNFMIIRWNGQLAPCTLNPRVINGMELSYGTLDETDNLLDMYNNTAITRLRESQNVGVYPPPCDKCSFPYTGAGLRGEITLRQYPAQKYFYVRDYYNTIFSKTQKWKPDSYYTGVEESK